MNVCILIPAYNESREIGRLVRTLRKQNLTVVVVDDGSDDGTGAIATAEGATVLKHDKKQGKGNSLRDGFRFVLEHDYDAVLALDGDGQHDILDIRRFLEAAEETGAGVVNGNRMDDPRGMPRLRFWTNRLMSWVISVICGQTIPDTQCGFRLICCSVLRDLRLTVSDYEIESEILIQASRLGHRVHSVPTKTIYSGESSKINPCIDTFRFFVYIMKELLTPQKTRKSPR